MKFSFKRVKAVHIIYILWVLSVVYIFVGPYWMNNRDFKETSYYRETINKLASAKPLYETGSLRVGYAERIIKTELGQPIMGFTDREPLGNEGTLTPCFAKSLTVGVGDKKVSIVAVDVMLLLGKIIDDIYLETGLERDEIFFTATHTHSGVGGWYKGIVLEQFYGKYNEKYYSALKNAIVESIRNSRKKLVQARMVYTKVNARSWLEDRIYKDHPAPADSGFHDVNPYITALTFLDNDNPDKILYILTSFAAHATVVRKDIRKFSADYPGEICRELQKLSNANGVLFAAGSVGDARASVLHFDGAKKMGEALATSLYSEIVKSKPLEVTSMYSLNFQVSMPEARFSFLGPRFGLMPMLAAYLFDNPVHLAVLKLGEFALVGMPADVAGELTTSLQEKAPVLVTSFNGSWKGYITKEDTYLNVDTYATRNMGLAGPQAGEFLMDITEKIYNSQIKK